MITTLVSGPIDDTVLRNLSLDLGEEWKSLASYLNVKKTRIQSIMRNHVNTDTEEVSPSMLDVPWLSGLTEREQSGLGFRLNTGENLS